MEPPQLRLQVRLTFLSDLQVRLTFGQMDPLAETSCGQVCYYFGQVDLWSGVPPAQWGFGSG